MKKRPDITDQTREKLIDAFWELYQKKGVDEIRIKEITDLAGYHRSTFYEYFTDIYDLLGQEEQALVSQIRQEKEQSDSGETFFSEIVAFYQANAAHVSLLLERGNRAFVHSLSDMLYPIFLEESKEKDSGKIEVIFAFGLNGMLYALDAWYRNPSALSLEETVQTMQAVFTRGILQALGRAGGDGE